MPSDDTPEFRAAQSKHAAKIQQERNLMEITGLNRSQIRAGLRSFEQRTQTAGFKGNAEVKGPTATELPSLPQLTKFDAKPFTLQQEGGGGKPVGDQATGEITADVVIIDGVGYTGTKLNGTLGTPI